MSDYVIADGGRRRLMLLVACFGALIANLDATIVNVCLPTMAAEWNLSPSKVSLVVLAYLMFETGPILACGKLGDRFGARKVFLWGLGLFTLSSLFCGLSGSLWELVAMRALQGMGGSMIFAVMLTFPSLHLPATERGRAMGFLTMSAALGVATGPVIGGLIAHWWGWRFIFYVNVPIGLATVLVGAAVLPREHPPARDTGFDGLGAIYQTLALLGLIFALNQGHELGWKSAPVVVAFVAGVGFILLLLQRERRVSCPVLDLRPFADRNLRLAALNMCLSMMLMGGMLFLMPFYLQDIRGLKVGTVGPILGIVSLGQFLGPTAGRLGDRVGPRQVALAGVTLGLLAFVMFATMDYGEQLWFVLAALALFGISQGLNRAPNIQLVMAGVPAEMKATAGSITSLMRSLGLALGVVLFETTFSHYLPRSIAVDAVSLPASGITPKMLHEGCEAALLVGLAISLAMVVTIAAVRQAKPRN